MLKLADQIKVIVAEMLERRIKDPRLGFITVTDVRLTGDSREATVFYTVLGSDARSGGHGGGAGVGDRPDPVPGRQAARAEVHPDADFVPDAVPETARQIDDLLAPGPGRSTPGWPSRLPAPATPATPIRTSIPTSDEDECLSRPTVRRPGRHRQAGRAGPPIRSSAGSGGSLGTRKVGHAGTLDPMATGVLVVGVNRATRLLGQLALTDKAYDGHHPAGRGHGHRRRRGRGDCSSRARSTSTRSGVEAALAAAARRDPPAVPVRGVGDQGRRRALLRPGPGRARRSTLAARPVTGQSLRGAASGGRRGSTALPVVDLDVDVECSPGTYVRALARDLGAALGTGGHLTALRRTRVGPFDQLAEAQPLTDDAADVARSLAERGHVAAFQCARRWTDPTAAAHALRRGG